VDVGASRSPAPSRGGSGLRRRLQPLLSGDYTTVMTGRSRPVTPVVPHPRCPFAAVGRRPEDGLRRAAVVLDGRSAGSCKEDAGVGDGRAVVVAEDGMYPACPK